MQTRPTEAQRRAELVAWMQRYPHHSRTYLHKFAGFPTKLIQQLEAEGLIKFQKTVRGWRKTGHMGVAK